MAGRRTRDWFDGLTPDDRTVLVALGVLKPGHDPKTCGVDGRPLCRHCDGWARVRHDPPVPFDSPAYRALSDGWRRAYAEYVARFGCWPVRDDWRDMLHAVRMQEQDRELVFAVEWEREREREGV